MTQEQKTLIHSYRKSPFWRTKPNGTKNPDNYYPDIIGQDWEVLKCFLFHVCSEKNRPNYKFNVIPPDVLREISEVKNLKIFDELEIRTDENGADAICFGVRRTGCRKPRRFLIVRWGIKRHSLEEMHRVVSVSRLKVVKIERVGWAISLGCVAALAIGGALMGSTYNVALGAMGIGAVLGLSLGWCVSYIYKGSALMKLNLYGRG